MLFSAESSAFADYLGSEITSEVNQILFKYILLI